jgi:hypothetical protein
VLTRGTRSTVFGFTSNLPPAFEAIRVYGPAKEKPPEGGTADSTAINAEGQAPTPKPESAAAPPPPLAPPLPEAPATPLAVASPTTPALTQLTTAPPPTSAAAAASGGGGNGRQNQQQQQQQQQQSPQGQQTPLQQINVTVQQSVTQSTSVNQTQSQSQDQSQDQSQTQTQTQSQSQSQKQSQDHSRHQPGHDPSHSRDPGSPGVEVVPEPATWLAGVLGLTFLLMCCSRLMFPAAAGTRRG